MACAIEAISKTLPEKKRPENDVEQAVTYPLFTPLEQEKATTQLQQFLDKQRN